MSLTASSVSRGDVCLLFCASSDGRGLRKGSGVCCKLGGGGSIAATEAAGGVCRCVGGMCSLLERLDFWGE